MTADRPTLLVVDDEPEVLRSLYDLFRLDYEVLTTTSGSEALEILKAREVAVILSDQRMSEMTGVEVLRHARDLRPSATRLLFTGYADISAVIDAINQGHVFRYITKPWEVPELQEVVRHAVERHGLISERNRLLAELERSNTQLAEANRLKDCFLEVASHELNTPVAVVLGLSELWAMTDGASAAPAERQRMERIRAAGRRLATIVERMLQLIRSGRFEGATLQRRPTDLDPLIRRAVADLEPFRAIRGQSLDIRIAPDLGVAEVDAEKVLDIVANLLINAIKFTPDGGRIVVEARADPAETVRIRVSDPGLGIKPEDRKHLFEPFFTGHDTRHHSSGEYQFGKRGIGLGLCLVKTFAELHGGSVTCESQPDRGSTFEVILPRTDPARVPSAVAGMPPPISQSGPAPQPEDVVAGCSSR